MSNLQTYYTVNTVDLSSIFQPIFYGSNIGYDTGYTVSGQDLRNIFASLGSGSSIGYNTGYSVSGHGDLSTIFAAATFSVVTISNISNISYYQASQGGYTIYTFDLTNSVPSASWRPGTGYVSFSKSITINIILIGGGGGGGFGSNSSGDIPGGGNGGGGGGYYNNISITVIDLMHFKLEVVVQCI